MVPSGWKLTSLGEVCSGNLQTGPFGSQLHSHEYTDEGVPVLMPKDLRNHRADYKSASKIPPNRADDLAKHFLQSGDILFSRRGDVSRFALIEENDEIGICGTGCLKATPNSEHSSLFLSFFLQKNAVKRWLEQNSVGQTMPNMNTAILAELPLMVASSREEEDKIAKILSTWDKAISTTERLIDTSKRQKKALMQQLLTGKKRLLDGSGIPFEREWKDVELGSIVDRPICYGVLKPGEHTEGGIPLLRIQDLRGSLLNEGQMIRITEELHQEFKRTILREGDLVMSIVGTLGKVLKIPKQLEGANITRAFAVIGIAEHSTDFIKQYLTSDYIQEWLLNTATGNAQKVLNVAAIKKLKIRVPSIQEQRKIAILLGNADKEIELFEQKLAYLKQEKKALMQQLLTGKRRVKV